MMPHCRRVALLDWDGSLREGFTIVDWTAYLADIGLIQEAAARGIRAAVAAYGAGEMTHDDVIRGSGEMYAGAVAGVAEETLRELALAFEAQDSGAVFTLTADIFAFLRSNDIQPILISGAPEHPLMLQARTRGVSQYHSLRLEMRAGIATGRVLVNPGTSDGKRRIVDHLLESESLIVEVAVGNSESDVPLFDAARATIVIDNDSVARRRGGFRALSTGTDINDILMAVSDQLALRE